MKRAKMGRPPVPKSEFKGVLIGARFKPDESKTVHAAIKRSGKVKSDWIREHLLTAAKDGTI